MLRYQTRTLPTVLKPNRYFYTNGSPPISSTWWCRFRFDYLSYAIYVRFLMSHALETDRESAYQASPPRDSQSGAPKHRSFCTARSARFSSNVDKDELWRKKTGWGATEKDVTRVYTYSLFRQIGILMPSDRVWSRKGLNWITIRSQKT